MRRMGSQAAATLLTAMVALWPATSVCAQTQGPGLSGLQRDATYLQGNLSDPSWSIEKINGTAFRLFNVGLPSTSVAFHFQAHPWRTMGQSDFSQKPATVADLVSKAQSFPAKAQEVPPPPKLAQSLNALGEMDSAGRIALDDGDSLSRREMGVYEFKVDGAGLGRIILNKITPAIAALSGLTLAASTLVHEAYHRVEKASGQLNGETIAAEVGAFKAQYEYIKAAYPTGEEITTRRIALAQMMRTHPSASVAAAQGFVATMDALFGTGGNLDAIRNLVLELGYSAKGGARGQSAFPSA